MEEPQNNQPIRPAVFSEAELDALEAARPEGLSSAEIVGLFAERGAKLSEATFRKYVQLGLLPRSRRVGSKGKHKGSRGVYPAGTVRQINEIKRLMALDYTIEEIRLRFAFVGGELEELRALVVRIIDRLEESLAVAGQDSLVGVTVRRQIDEARVAAEALIAQLEEAATRLREQARTTREAI